MALRLQTFIFCTEFSFSAILRMAVLLEQRIMAFFICTTSQSESVTPSSTERLFVPNKHRSTRISDNWLITCEPMLMLVLRESLPPIRITSAWVRSASSRATSGLMVKNVRSEEHTSELQSLMRISYAVFCLKKKKNKTGRKKKEKY